MEMEKRKCGVRVGVVFQRSIGRVGSRFLPAVVKDETDKK
jgi:hypothetical protein